MRRILRKIAANEVDQLGDVSTLADPSVVEQLVRGLTDTQRAELREAFAAIDGNGDGHIEIAEFARLLASLRTPSIAAEAQRDFEIIDTDSDGSIAFDEFAAWWIRD
jgi:Ca2+-binding EF-hand superfamily protein